MGTDTRAMSQPVYVLTFNAVGEEVMQACCKLNMMPGVDVKYDPFSWPSVVVTSCDHAWLLRMKEMLEHSPAYMKATGVKLRKL